MTNWGTIVSASGKAVSQEEMIAEKILRWGKGEERVEWSREEREEGREGGEERKGGKHVIKVRIQTRVDNHTQIRQPYTD